MITRRKYFYAPPVSGNTILSSKVYLWECDMLNSGINAKLMFILDLKYFIWKTENANDFYKEGTKKYFLKKYHY